MGANRLLCVFASIAILFSSHPHALRSQSVNSPPPPSKPPVAPIRPMTDDYFGTKVVDPYRYMENLQDPEVQAWMKAQNDYTRAVLANVPGREQLLARIRELDQAVPFVDAWRLPGDLYLTSKRLPAEDVQKLYLRRGLSGEDQLLVDPEKVKSTGSSHSKGTNALQDVAPSPDAKYVVVGVAPGGAERDDELHVFETTSGRETGDVIARAWGEGGPTWLPGNRSFVYPRRQELTPDAPAKEIEQKDRYYLHVLGTDPEKDRAVFGYGVVPSIKVDPLYLARVVVQPDSQYALGAFVATSPNRPFCVEPVADLGKTDLAWRKVADFSDDVNDVEVHGNDLYALTFKDAPRYKVIRTDARSPNLASAETIVPPSQAVVRSIHAAQDALYVRLLDGGISRLLRVPYGPTPQVEEVALPFQGSILAVQTDLRIPGALLGVTSWTEAFKYYAYDPETKQATDTKLQPSGPYDDPTNIESAEVKVQSYDGTQVPLSITYPKAMKRDGSNSTLLDAYGAYGYWFPPNFDPLRLAWFEKGGVYAACHVRGGGEYGEEWHLAGKEATKPNTWLDFTACAQYLIDQKYTSPARLAGEGGSAGGILIGRAITERPDLFRAAIDQVGGSDMLRMETTANGLPNITEFGSTKTEDGFKALYAMSAYHHIKDGTAYPAVLFETGMNDPRTDPWQMAKMTARMQAATTSGKPVPLRVEYQGGHGGIARQAQERRADDWSFLLWQFGVPEFQPPNP
ncbi:MAG TPA: prolyl oligopeptidase family serine peptidase [Terriglobia bacterium]